MSAPKKNIAVENKDTIAKEKNVLLLCQLLIILTMIVGTLVEFIIT